MKKSQVPVESRPEGLNSTDTLEAIQKEAVRQDIFFNSFVKQSVGKYTTCHGLRLFRDSPLSFSVSELILAIKK